jgi:hypothetical protein
MEVERRRQKRRRFTYYMPVLDASTLQIVGHLSDISPLGIRLDTEKPLPVNANYKLRLDLTPEMANKTAMVFNGRSKWCAMDKLSPNSYNVGIEFGALANEDAAIFQRMYENYSSDRVW